jgi:hypothetical protein
MYPQGNFMRFGLEMKVANTSLGNKLESVTVRGGKYIFHEMYQSPIASQRIKSVVALLRKIY